MSDDETRFGAAVRTKAARRIRALRASQRPVWFGLGMFGVIGWSVATPTLLGAMLGAWLDRHHPGTAGGGRSWTLALLVAGLVLGCANAWYWITAQTAAMSRESDLHE